MTQSLLDDLCRQYGVTTDYGIEAAVPDTTKRQLLKAIGIDAESAPSGDVALECPR